uniref:Reelin domain-containing protein n=1 Tax=Caenorhabditis japonica TaxID=281687 RepID=A0A8R1E1F0_CAEJA
MIHLHLLLLSILVPTAVTTDGFKELYETTGFHCYSRDSMRLPRHLHGKPQTTDPPFDLSVLDQNGKKVDSYKVGEIYTVKLEAYVHFRGLMLQPRLCTPSGAIIGSLRGGKFIEDFRFETYGEYPPFNQSGPEQSNSWKACCNGASERGDQNISGGAAVFDERVTGSSQHGARQEASLHDQANKSCQCEARATRSSETRTNPRAARSLDAIDNRW